MGKSNIVIGILAHVDAGKTTLSESMLYVKGSIRKMGRVDHKDAFLDMEELERARGITIFSKQARFFLGDLGVTLLDTPGHVDFSAEMERTLQVLDYGILVINGADGVQGHTLTLWRLLDQYGIPVFLFINKMDQAGTDREALLRDITRKLDEFCLDFARGWADSDREAFLESLAMCEERVMDSYLQRGDIGEKEISRLIRERKVFPCYFGSALKVDGVEAFLADLQKYMRCPDYPEEFGARVFKISRDKQGNRLTHMKITGGKLLVRDYLTGGRSRDEEDGKQQEKVTQIRVYSGEKFQTADEAPPGMICAVTGPMQTFTGEGLGYMREVNHPLLTPVLTYQIILPDCDPHQMLIKLRQLEEEEPQLKIVWKEQLNEIHIQVMGEVEMEILKVLIRERFQTEVEFGTGSIIYKETILAPVTGAGHFEPLRHYAEVHLLLEPLERGRGLVFETDCSEDVLGRNWQRLVMTHLQEKIHTGVLTGSEITDMKITLIAGRSHNKHTEGGDFRQATFRALRQGLMKAESILLEPYYKFHLEIPARMLGRALSDLKRMHARTDSPVMQGDQAILTGSGPVVAMQEYQMEVAAYSKGHGKWFCSLQGYESCHNAEEVIAACAYDSENDPENPAGSVFCTHGSGFLVSWDQADSYMHVESGIVLERDSREASQPECYMTSNTAGHRKGSDKSFENEKELEAIFERTYGPVKRDRNPFKRTIQSREDSAYTYKPGKKQPVQEAYLLVDGYNIIFSWEELRDLAQVSLDGARYRLMDILCNYQGYKKNTIILVFDAYKVVDNPGNVQKYHNIYVVYTKVAETADQYIEKTVHEMNRKYDVTVATSDALEQMIIWGAGARRLSAQGLLEEVLMTEKEIRSEYLEQTKPERNYPLRDAMDDTDKLQFRG